MTANVDPYVEAVIVERLSRADVAELVTLPTSAAVDTAALHREAAAIRRNLEQSASDAMLDLISRAEHLAASATGRRRLDEIGAALAESVSGSALAPFAGAESANAVWDGLDTARKRAVIEALTPVIIHPAGKGVRSFNPATVVMPWQRNQS
jgi:site-specific DNA recombinase